MSSYALVHEVYGTTPPDHSPRPPSIPVPPKESLGLRRGRIERQLREIYSRSGIFGIASLMSDEMLSDMKSLICVSKRLSPLSQFTNEHLVLIIAVVLLLLFIAKST